MKNVKNVNNNKRSTINSESFAPEDQKEQTQLLKKGKKQFQRHQQRRMLHQVGRYLAVANAMKGQSRKELTSDYLFCLL